MTKIGRTPIGPRAMTSAERVRACRARKRARKLAERPELLEAAAMTAITSRVVPPPPAIVAAVRAADRAENLALALEPPPLPPLPADPVERAAAAVTEIETVFRTIALDQSAPAAARNAAARSWAELMGIMKTRAPAERLPSEEDRAERMSGEELAAHAEATRQEAAALRALLIAHRDEPMPWD